MCPDMSGVFFFFFFFILFISNKLLQLLHCVGFSFGTDLPPPPEPPPCQGPSRVPGARSISSMVPPTERKASSLERTPVSGAPSGPDDMKSSVDRQARTSLEHHRQTQDRLGSMDRADDGRRGHKTGSIETIETKVLWWWRIKSQGGQTYLDLFFGNTFNDRYMAGLTTDISIT